MKPETIIALVRMAEKAKRIQAEEYSGRWIKLGLVGAVLSSLLGVYLLSLAITVISRGNEPILGALFLLATLMNILMPWYFTIRHNFNRDIQLLCEAILSVDQDQGGVAAQPVADPASKIAGRRRRRRSNRRSRRP